MPAWVSRLFSGTLDQEITGILRGPEAPDSLRNVICGPRNGIDKVLLVGCIEAKWGCWLGSHCYLFLSCAESLKVCTWWNRWRQGG